MADNVQRSDTTHQQAASLLPESSIPVIQEFNGNPTLLFNPGGRFPFSIGLSKARMVLQHVAFIQRFVDNKGLSLD